MIIPKKWCRRHPWAARVGLLLVVVGSWTIALILVVLLYPFGFGAERPLKEEIKLTMISWREYVDFWKELDRGKDGGRHE
jgi:hypothetical protein